MRIRRRNANNQDKTVKLNFDQLKRSLRIFTYVLPYKWAFFLSIIFLAGGSLLFLAIMKNLEVMILFILIMPILCMTSSMMKEPPLFIHIKQLEWIMGDILSF